MISHWAFCMSETLSRAATAHVSSTAASRRGRHSASLRSSPIGRCVSAVAAATGAWVQTTAQSTSASLPLTRTRHRNVQQLGCVRVGVLGERQNHGGGVLDDHSRPLEVRLDEADAAGDDDAVRERAADGVHVLDAVQQGDDCFDGHPHAAEGILECGRLDGDEQKINRVVELGGSFGKHDIAALAVSQAQPLGRDQSGRVRTGDADPR